MIAKNDHRYAAVVVFAVVVGLAVAAVAGLQVEVEE